MPINRDLSGLAPGEPSIPEGRPPDRDEWIVGPLLENFLDHHDEGPRPMSVAGRRWRASWSGKCLRQQAYLAAGVEPSEAPDDASRWSMTLGRLLHELLQETVPPEWEPEVAVDLRPDIDGAASADLIVTRPDGTRVYVEIKTKNGFGFKNEACNFNGPPQGPSVLAILQGAVGARAADCDELVIVTVSLERAAARYVHHPDSRFGGVAAQWTFDRTQIDTYAQMEQKRIGPALEATDPNQVPPRVWTDDLKLTTVVNPSRGLTIDDTGVSSKTWQCQYCDFRTHCAEKGAW